MGKPNLLVVDKSIGETYGVEQAGRSAPLTWGDAVAAIAVGITGKPPVPLTLRAVFFRRAWFLCWGPSLLCFLAAVLGRRLIYLCWGVPKPQGKRWLLRLKLFRLSRILNGAKVVYVNDRVSRDDVLRLSGRNAKRVAYAVDCDYFVFAGNLTRRPFALVPGDNDRDEQLVRDLAARGLGVIRVTRTQSVLDWHNSFVPLPALQVKFRIPYEELAELYRTAMVVCLPLVAQNHPGGQTSVLEALASGVPVVISEGRISSEVEPFPSVFVCQTNDPDEWASAIERARLLLQISPAMFEQVSCEIRRTHHTQEVAKALVAEIGALCSSTPTRTGGLVGLG